MLTVLLGGEHRSVWSFQLRIRENDGRGCGLTNAFGATNITSAKCLVGSMPARGIGVLSRPAPSICLARESYSGNRDGSRTIIWELRLRMKPDIPTPKKSTWAAAKTRG